VVLRYDCDVAMRRMHRIESGRLLDVPSQRARHTLSLAVGVESQVSIDAYTTVRPTHGSSTGRFFEPVLARAPTSSKGPTDSTSRLLQPIMMYGSAHHESWFLYMRLR
jgi:hypothetical protein